VLASTHGHADADGRARGIAIHLMLERLTATAERNPEAMLLDIAGQLQRSGDDAELRDWWREARAVIDAPTLATLFDAKHYEKAFNEVAVQYLQDGRMIHGVIDRLLLTGDSVLVIDYKSHRLVDDAQVPTLLHEYRSQLQYYAGAAQRLWPDRTVRAGLLFTALPRLAWLDPAAA